MNVSLTDAKAQLTELVRRAERGEYICLTRHGQATVRLVPVVQAADSNTRLELLKRIIALGRARAVLGPEAARSHDDLYDDEGMPG
jgi:prevent-host-death family protein